MKVLFVSSGTKGKGSPIVKSQGESLKKHHVEIDYFLVLEPGINGYLKSIIRLREYLKTKQYDIVHAHYALSGFLASLSGTRKLVVSLMGDDVLTSKLLFLTKYFALFIWDKTIVKSIEMQEQIDLSKVEIIANGVDFEKFISLDKKTCQLKLGYQVEVQHLLFAANPNSEGKNYTLFKQACDILIKKGYNFEIHYFDNIPHELIPYYMNAADVVCLSSLSEGSPNVVKEAMACNRPIVSTDEGDVRMLLEPLDGCFVSSFVVNDYAMCLQKALKYSTVSKSTFGRNRLMELGLDSDSVALIC